MMSSELSFERCDSLLELQDPLLQLDTLGAEGEQRVSAA